MPPAWETLIFADILSTLTRNKQGSGVYQFSLLWFLSQKPPTGTFAYSILQRKADFTLLSFFTLGKVEICNISQHLKSFLLSNWRVLGVK